MLAPLVPQVVPILFGKFDSKTAPRLAQQGTFVQLENLAMTQTGRLQKRHGYQLLSGSPNFNTAKSLSVLGSELVVTDSGGRVLGWEPGLGTNGVRKLRGQWSNVQPTLDFVISNAASQSIPDVAVGNGYECHVWEDTRSGGQIRYSVRNIATGQWTAFDVKIDGDSANITQPKVGYAAGKFFVFYQTNATTLVTRTLTTSGSISGSTTITSTLTSGIWDVIVRPTDQRILIAAQLTSPAGLNVYQWDPLNKVTEILVTNGGITAASVGWLEHDWSDAKGYLGVGTSTPATLLLTLDLFQNTTLNQTVETGVAQPTQITGYVDLTTSPSTKYVLAQRQGGSSKTINDSVLKGVVDSGISNASLAKGVGLASRAVVVSNVGYVVTTYEGGQNTSGVETNQQTYFVHRVTDGEIVARFLTRKGTGMRARSNTLASARAISSSQVVCPVAQKVQSAFENSATVIVKSIARTLLDFADVGLSPPLAVGRGLVIPGGTVRYYDGGAVAELGFHVSPEQPTSALATTTAGSMTGDYKFIYVYAWFDRYGQLHRSAPSPASATVNVNGTANHSVIHTIPSLRLSAKTNVIVEIYRQNPGDTNYYKITSSVTPLFNVANSDVTTYTDSLSDSEASKREILYTTPNIAGGVLANDPPPPGRVVAAYKDRLVVAGQDLPNRYWLSKPIVPDVGIGFTDNFEQITSSVDGEVTEIEQLDDRAIVFFKNAIGWFSGDGPDASGAGGDWSTLVRLPGANGTTSPASVARTQQGLMYRSTNAGGLYVLDRGLQNQYIGSDVEGFNSKDITSVVTLADVNQTRFTTATGTTLVRDDFHQRWYVWTNQTIAGSVVQNNLFTFVAPDGSLYQETATGYADNGTPIKARFTLAWLSPFGVGAQGRLWALHLIGDYRDAHQVRVGLRYDHQDAITWEELQIDAAAACASSAFGTASPYGTGTFGGAVTGDYRFEVRPRIQRGSAFQITVEDVISDGSPNAGLDLSAIVMLVGAQPGKTAQLPAARQMATQ